MTTTINSNGSKWAGEAPDSIDTLVDVLGKYDLDRQFEDSGGFIFKSPNDKHVQFRGNFLNLSHVFNIDTDDASTIGRLSAAVLANQKHLGYLAQPSADERKRAKREKSNEWLKAHHERRKALGYAS